MPARLHRPRRNLAATPPLHKKAMAVQPPTTPHLDRLRRTKTPPTLLIHSLIFNPPMLFLPPPQTIGSHPSSSINRTPPPYPPSIQWLTSPQSHRTTALQPVLTSTPLLTALSYTHPSLTPSPLPPHLAHTSSLASHLSTRHAHLLSLRHQTQTHLLQLRALEHQWRSKQSLMDEQLEPWSAKSLYQRLIKAEKEGEEISKAMEESWMDGSDGDVEGFLRRYREGRKAVARRREMRERWDEGRVGGWR